MRLISNNQEIPVDEKADIIIEKFSPITNLEIKGEYALSFNNPVTPELQAAMGFSNIPNIQNPTTKIDVALFDDNLIFTGDLSTKSVNRFQYQQELTTTPGGVPLDVWKRKISDIDFGKDTIPTLTQLTNLYRIPLKEPIGSSPSNANTYTFDELLGYKQTRLYFYIDGIEVYSHVFSYIGISVSDFLLNRQQELDKVVDEFNASQESTTKGILERNSDEWVIRFPTGTTHIVTAKIRVEYTSVDFDVNYNFTRISFQSIGDYFDDALKSTWNKPYLLPQIYAPNIYSDKNTSFNGNINAINRDKYLYNTENEPTKYTFVPAFKFQYILQKLAEYMGYTLDTTFFDTDNNNKIYWLTMVCADRQFPNLTKPYNIHANEIIYKDYLPKWTVQEFVNRFQNWLNCYLEFDIFTKKLSIISRQKPFANISDQEMIDLSTISDDDYSLPTTTRETFQVKFAITESDDESLVTSAFKPFPNTQEPGFTWKEIENHFAPLTMSTDYVQTTQRTEGNIVRYNSTSGHPSPWNWSNNSSGGSTSTIRKGILVCYQTGKSTMFGLNTEEPKSRSLFCAIEADTLLAENTLVNKSLFIDGEKGLYQKNWKSYIKGLSENYTVQLNVYLNKLKLHQFNWSTIFYYFNCAWIAAQISVNPRLKISKIKLRRIKAE